MVVLVVNPLQNTAGQLIKLDRPLDLLSAALQSAASSLRVRVVAKLLLDHRDIHRTRALLYVTHITVWHVRAHRQLAVFDLVQVAGLETRRRLGAMQAAGALQLYRRHGAVRCADARALPEYSWGCRDGYRPELSPRTAATGLSALKTTGECCCVSSSTIQVQTNYIVQLYTLLQAVICHSQGGLHGPVSGASTCGTRL